jgi:hypothetical protein
MPRAVMGDNNVDMLQQPINKFATLSNNSDPQVASTSCTSVSFSPCEPGMMPPPKEVNGRGYLLVTKKSLWWQHEQFPNVWTSEGLTTCMENGYQWTVNSTTWNHLQTMWQAQSLDLLRLIHEETHHQNILEASGYRFPTWCILRTLQAIIKANVVVGESTITAAPFFEGVGRPSKPFWGPQQGQRVILWESLRPEDH